MSEKHLLDSMFTTLLSFLLMADYQKPPLIEIEATTSAYSEIDSCHYKNCLMANNEPAHVGAVACGRMIPLWTRIEIEGITYICKDRTAKKHDGKIDIFMGYGKDAYQKALQYGVQRKTIKILP